MWEKFKTFLKRKDIEVSVKRYGIDALGAMAQGLFCTLLVGTILNTLVRISPMVIKSLPPQPMEQIPRVVTSPIGSDTASIIILR